MPDKQLRATLAIASSMCGLWFLGVFALMLAPADSGSQYAKEPMNFRYQATGVTHAYQDVTGRYTVYIRGRQRISAPRSSSRWTRDPSQTEFAGSSAQLKLRSTTMQEIFEAFTDRFHWPDQVAAFAGNGARNGDRPALTREVSSWGWARP